MIFDIILILAITFFSIKIQHSLKIPSPLSLLILSFISGIFIPNFLNFTTPELFSEEMVIFIVLLVLGDAFILKLKTLKENWLSILILAVVFVAVTILISLLFKEMIFGNKDISIGALIALFAMVTATDPVSVISVFKMYKLPHKLEVLAEGESLFNDAMALTMFSAIGIYLMENNSINITYISLSTIEIFGGSILLGISIGFVGLLLMKTTKDLMGEFILLLLIAYTSYFLAENIHVIGDNPLSGLLAEIVSILTMTTIIDKSYEREQKAKERKQNILSNISTNETKYAIKKVKLIIHSLSINVTDIKRQQDIGAFLSVLSLLVNGTLFVSLARLVDIDNLILYWKEILFVFIISTLIRTFLIGLFSYVSKKTNSIKDMNFNWFLILNFAGIKGGLSVVMLHMLFQHFPNFEYKNMYESIVIGIILLTTFIYVPILMFVSKKIKKNGA